jgi:hypothetical protein
MPLYEQISKLAIEPAMEVFQIFYIVLLQYRPVRYRSLKRNKILFMINFYYYNTGLYGIGPQKRNEILFMFNF